MLPDRADPLVGTMLGKDYKVLQPIGRGGMAVVYLVEHQTLLKQFAAKVLGEHLASSLEARARFAQEAHAASQLDHENIVSISDFGVTGDQRPFFVMELLRGQTLDERLAEGPMTLEEVVAVCVPVARALAHAHVEGIVHLDVKPENIFLVQRSQGRWGVKVVDFGIAKTPLSPRPATADETVGSPMFMAPEMCVGADDVDQRADIYSFGILLYLMICGRLPFVDDNVDRVLQMQLVELPAPPCELNSELTPELAAVVERALAKRPQDRYPSMAAMLRDLDAALPIGADRLLIEAQSGTAVRETPFPVAMTVARHESHRMPRASHPMPPSGVLSSQPPAPKRRRAVIMVPLLAIAVGLLGAFAWRHVTNAGTAQASGAAKLAAAAASHDPPAAANTPQVTPIQPEATPAAPGASDDHAAVAANEPTAPAADPALAIDDDPAPSTGANAVGVAAAAPPAAVAVVVPTKAQVIEPPRVERTVASAKKQPVRPKPIVRREPPRPIKRPGAPILAVNQPSRPNLAGSETANADSEPAAAPEPRRPEPAAEPAPPPPPAVTPPPVAPPVAIAPVVPPVSPLKPPAPPPVNPGSLDAVPSVVSLEVKGSLSPSIVRRSLERTLSSLRGCYRTAARAGGATPAIDLQLNFEIDENGLATQIATSGAKFGSLASCAAGVASQIRTPQAPDVGTAQVTVGIRFRPS